MLVSLKMCEQLQNYVYGTLQYDDYHRPRDYQFTQKSFVRKSLATVPLIPFSFPKFCLQAVKPPPMYQLIRSFCWAYYTYL